LTIRFSFRYIGGRVGMITDTPFLVDRPDDRK